MSENYNLRGNSVLILAGLIIVAAGLKSSQDLMVPFLLSVFIATIAATPMFWLQRKGVPESFSLPVVIILMIVGIALMGALIAQSASAFTAKLPFYQERLVDLQQELAVWLVPLLQPLGVESIDVQVLFSNFSPNAALDLAGSTLARLGGVLSNSFLIILTVIFILAEAASFPKKLHEVLKDPDRDLPHFAKFGQNVNRYIAIKTSVSAATGIVVSIFLWILNVDFPILWGILAFLLNYVPTIGSIIAAAPPVLLALIQLGPGAAGGVAIGFVAINLIMGNAIEPRFMGKGLGLSTLVVFLSLVVWGWVLGPVGMLLSVPLTITAKIALEANPDTQWIALLLGPADALEEEDTEDVATRESENEDNRIAQNEAYEATDDPNMDDTAQANETTSNTDDDKPIA